MTHTITDATEARTGRLSPPEAMRLGRAQIPYRSHGALVETTTTSALDGESGEVTMVEHPIAACDLGAMAIGYGQDPDELRHFAYWWPDDQPESFVDLPCGHGQNPKLISEAVAHLSDDHMNDESWQTEQVAQWLEGVLNG